MEAKKLVEKKTEDRKENAGIRDPALTEGMRNLTSTLAEYLGRKFGYEFEIQEEELDSFHMPEMAVYSVYDRKKEIYVDAQPLIARLPDWLRPFAKARLMAGGNVLLLWWGRSDTPQARQVLEGVMTELAAMGPEAVPEPPQEDGDDPTS